MGEFHKRTLYRVAGVVLLGYGCLWAGYLIGKHHALRDNQTCTAGAACEHASP